MNIFLYRELEAIGFNEFYTAVIENKQEEDVKTS